MRTEQDLSVSAVVCAVAGVGWSDTVAAVQSLVDQSPPPVEVLVVTDHDGELAKRARATLKHRTVQILENVRGPGPSGSRNTATTDAVGDVVAFLHPGATARPGWCAALTQHYRRPEVVAVGGHVEPRWTDGDAPPCLPPELLWTVGCSDRGRHGAQARPVRDLLAGAMSFRRSDLLAIGGFSEFPGPPSGSCGGGETDVCLRLTRAVGRSSVVFEPSAVVDQRVKGLRARRTALVGRCWSEGVSKAFLARRVGRGDGLSVERDYLRDVLPRAWRREMGTAAGALVHRDGRALRRSLARACVLVVAVLVTGAGYVRGRAQSRARALPSSPAASRGSVPSGTATTVST